MSKTGNFQVLRFFARTGLPLRERPPMMLVDGDTLDQERKLCREADKEAPIFHTLGMCLLRGHGHVNHVVHSQPGFSSLYKQPSLNATLRPADLSQVEYEVGCSACWCSVPVACASISLKSYHASYAPSRACARRLEPHYQAVCSVACACNACKGQGMCSWYDKLKHLLF